MFVKIMEADYNLQKPYYLSIGIEKVKNHRAYYLLFN